MFRHRAALLSVLFFARRSHYNSPFERRAVGAHYFVPFPTMHRSYRFFRFGIVLQLAGLAALAACSSPPQQPKFQQEMFDTGASPFSRHFAATSSDACEAARRALLSQGYLTTTTRSDTIDASKDFQPSGDKHITVEFHVVCTAGDDAENSSLVYANAVQSGFALKKSDTSASVGLSIFGSLSLPIRSNSDAMVKVSSETIQSQKFYERFFDYVDPVRAGCRGRSLHESELPLEASGAAEGHRHRARRHCSGGLHFVDSRDRGCARLSRAGR